MLFLLIIFRSCIAYYTLHNERMTHVHSLDKSKKNGAMYKNWVAGNEMNKIRWSAIFLFSVCIVSRIKDETRHASKRWKKSAAAAHTVRAHTQQQKERARGRDRPNYSERRQVHSTAHILQWFGFLLGWHLIPSLYIPLLPRRFFLSSRFVSIFIYIFFFSYLFLRSYFRVCMAWIKKGEKKVKE